jgi:hypothetical protein
MMTLELWSNKSGHWFVDTDLDVQVGQAGQRPDGTWDLEVNDEFLTAPDLDSVMRVFVEHYDATLVQLSPMSEEGGMSRRRFKIVDLTPLQKSLKR